jgi:hypothetical protein
VSKREMDLGRLAQKVGRRLEDEGQATSQRLHDWKRTEQLPKTRGSCDGCDGFGWVGDEKCEQCGGTGDGGGFGNRDPKDSKQDREASRLSSEWTSIRVQLEHLLKRAAWLMDQAKAEHRQLDKHRTPAQVEADGWCGAHWHAVKALVPITLRSSGEPYYKGRCRFCGSWPGGDPPADVLRTRQAQRAAS